MKNLLINKKRNLNTIFFYLIPLGVILNMFLSWKYINCYSTDSFTYIRLANALPRIEDSIFPFLYPAMMKGITFFYKDYDFAFKVMNIFSVIFIFSFVRAKEFYWREIWILLTFSCFQNIYPLALSESLFFPLLIMFCYYNYKFLNKEIAGKKFVITCVLLLCFMFLVKYNTLFIIISTLLFALLLIKKNNFFARFYLLVGAISLILYFLFVLFNFFETGYFTGRRGLPEDFKYLYYVINSVKNIPLSFDPFAYSLQRIAVKVKIYYGFYYVTVIPYFTSYLVVIYLAFNLYRLKVKENLFVLFCAISSITFLFFSFVSAYKTQIDVLNFRLLLAFNVFTLVGIINLIEVKLNDVTLLSLGVLCILIFQISLIFLPSV